jgi:hypothetical protein
MFRQLIQTCNKWYVAPGILLGCEFLKYKPGKKLNLLDAYDKQLEETMCGADFNKINENSVFYMCVSVKTLISQTHKHSSNKYETRL